MRISLSLTVLCLPAAALPCTNYLITPGASVDGSAMITYAADAHDFYGELYFRETRDHEPGAVREIIEWDTGKPLGAIPEPAHTFRRVGNINQHQVAIGETTFGGRKELVNPKGGLDYGSLMYIALERARSAREAIEVITTLVAEHGYYSSGESFSIADPTEVWLLEMVGKGPGKKGALWVARKIPDGYVSGHANQARIRTFPLDDPATALYAPDVISFARARGYFNGEDHEFSFADAYAPFDFSALRVGEARVWSFFRKVAPSLGLSPDWVMGNIEATPLPLWVKPDEKLSVADVMGLMRDHFDDSPMSFEDDVGAGPHGLPYRWRPLYWKLDGVKYFNERAVSTQQTAFSFVAQSRGDLPGDLGGVLWFGVDDTNSTVYVPMYAGLTRAPENFAVGTGDFRTFTWDSAFWTFNWVSNFAYSRYRDMIRDVRRVQSDLEGIFLTAVTEADAAAAELHAASPEKARAYVTEFSLDAAALTHQRWRRLGEELLMKYLDGNVRQRGEVTHPPYPEAWYRRIVEETGDRYRFGTVPGEMKYYQSRAELRERAEHLPAAFDFTTQKVWLHSGTARCGQMPRCCLTTEVIDDALRARVPRTPPADDNEARERRRCGEPGWLVPVPVTEKRDVIPLFD